MAEDPIGREIAQLRKDHGEDFAQLRRDNADDFAQLRASFNDGLAQIRSMLSGMVPRELHDAQLERLRDQASADRRDLDRLTAAVEADRKAEEQRREAAAEQRKLDQRAEAAERAANRRILLGALWTAGVGILMQILSSAGVLP